MFLLVAGILVAGVVVFRLTRDMDPSQRIVAVVVFLLALIYLARKAMELGLLGNRAD